MYAFSSIIQRTLYRVYPLWINFQMQESPSNYPSDKLMQLIDVSCLYISTYVNDTLGEIPIVPPPVGRVKGAPENRSSHKRVALFVDVT